MEKPPSAFLPSYASVLHDVLKGDVKELTDVLIVQRIVDALPCPAIFHHAGLFQDPQLVGDGGLGHVEDTGQIADAKL